MQEEKPFFVRDPSNYKFPILISVPHSGTEIPHAIRRRLRPELVERPVDTDWFVHELYDFAEQLGIPMIHARYSRYVVDLNRNPSGQLLYRDGRSETGVVPTKTFDGYDLYVGQLPTPLEVTERVRQYHQPYHDEVWRLLKVLRSRWHHVLLFDGHSIKRMVPLISPQAFPDLILGNRDETSANPVLIQAALQTLKNESQYDVAHNHPFKGGFITQHFGRPEEGYHALQLEMANDIYLGTSGTNLDPIKAPRLKAVLEKTIVSLASAMERLL